MTKIIAIAVATRMVDPCAQPCRKLTDALLCHLAVTANRLRLPVRIVEQEPWALGMRFRDEPHGLSDVGRGVKFYVVALLTLLFAIVLLIAFTGWLSSVLNI